VYVSTTTLLLKVITQATCFDYWSVIFTMGTQSVHSILLLN